jgi:hypothetical protein
MEFCLAAVQQYGEALRHVPKELKAGVLFRKNFFEDFGI